MTRPAGQTPDVAGESPARGTWALLTDRAFGPYFAGRLMAMAGVWVFNIVAAIITWRLSASTLVVGAVSTAIFVPQLVLAPLSGAQADRRDPRTQLIFGRLLVMAASASLALAIGLVGEDGLPGAWAVVLASAVAGVGFAIGGPAQHSLLPTLVRSSELARAVALNSLPSSLARAGGPALGVLLLVTAGPAGAFAFTSLSNLAFAVAIATLPQRRAPKRATHASGTVRAGIDYVRAEPTVGYLVVGVLGTGLGADPVVTLTPALSASFGAGEALVGGFATAFGLGAALGYATLVPLGARWGLDGLGPRGLAYLAAGLLITGAAPAVWVAVGGLMMAGAGFSWSLTGLTTRLYQHVPGRLRGRMMALWSMAFLGSRPLGATTSGLIADASSVSVALASVAALVALLAFVCSTGLRRSVTSVRAGTSVHQ